MSAPTRGGIRRVLPAAAISALLLAAIAAPSADARVSREFFGLSPATNLTEREFKRMRRADVRAIRIPFPWDEIQPKRPRKGDGEDDYRWNRLDGQVALAAKYGIRVLPFVYVTPDWVAKRDTTPPLGSAKDKAAWRGLLKAAERRYGRGGKLWDDLAEFDPTINPRPITVWQIWNEPNARSFWTPTRTAPEQYAKLLEISSRTLEGGDHRARLVTAGLFYSPTHGMHSDDFLRRLYRVRGITKRFDALGLHPYAPDLDGVKFQIRLARKVMRKVRDRRTPLWITELGWPTDGDTGNPFYKTRRQQAKLLRRTWNLVLKNRRKWRVDRLNWYTWRDNQVNRDCSLCQFAGLFDADLNPKPAWSAFVDFTGGRE